MNKQTYYTVTTIAKQGQTPTETDYTRRDCALAAYKDAFKKGFYAAAVVYRTQLNHFDICSFRQIVTGR